MRQTGTLAANGWRTDYARLGRGWWREVPALLGDGYANGFCGMGCLSDSDGMRCFWGWWVLLIHTGSGTWALRMRALVWYWCYWVRLNGVMEFGRPIIEVIIRHKERTSSATTMW